MKKPEFAIFTLSYSPDIGGSIVLHKLCHLLNESGYSACLVPMFEQTLISRHRIRKPLGRVIKSLWKASPRFFKTNPAFNTPVFEGDLAELKHGVVAVYPEIVNGNPLEAKHVVRWFLHRPGFHTGVFCASVNELMFDFNNFTTGLNVPGSRLSAERLYVWHVPLEIYNEQGALPSDERRGTAYCVRKARNKPMQHDMQGAELIDGKSHEEIASIFKRVRRFVCYDAYTAYANFAVLCGAEVVVVPDEGVSKLQWLPEEAQRYGLAYGFDDIEHARATRHLVLPEFLKREAELKARVQRFVGECNDFFKLQRT